MTDTPLPPTLIQQLFTSLRETGLNPTLKALVHPDAVFIGVREEASEAVPIYGTFRGHAQIPDFFATLQRLFDTQSFELHHALENGDISMATGSFHHRVKDTGKDFLSHWACLCTIKDGKIGSYRFYEDTAALEASLRVET